eukprot:6239549-Amphidinium_carterae.1
MGVLHQTVQGMATGAAPPPPPPPGGGNVCAGAQQPLGTPGWRARRMSAGGTLRVVGVAGGGDGGEPSPSGDGSMSDAWKSKRERRTGRGDGGYSSDDGYEDAEDGEGMIRVKRKEANVIALPALPPPSQYRGWRINVLREIAAAACRPKQAFTWAEKCDNPSVPDSELFVTGAQHETLDAKIASALARILPANADLNRRVQTKILADAKEGKFTTGRLILRQVMAHYQTCRDHASLYSVNDLLQIRVPSQTSEGLSSFLTNWLWIEQGLQEEIGDALKESLLWAQLKDCGAIATEVLPYRLSDRGDVHHSYEALLRVLVRHVERYRQEKVRSQMLLGMQQAGGGPVPAMPVTGERASPAGPGAKDRTCWAYAKGECTRGSKCRFEHVDGGGVKAAAATQKRSASRTRPCNAFQRGQCKYGDKCKFAHGVPAHVAEADEAAMANMREQTPPPVAVYSDGSSVQYACVSSVVSSNTEACPGKQGATCHKCSSHVGSRKEACCNCRSWLGDTGAGRDLIGRGKLREDELARICRMHKKCRFNTANGSVTADEKVKCEISSLGRALEPVVLEQCPPVMSIGRRVEEEGYEFHWVPGCAELVTPTGNRVSFDVKGYVPLMNDACEVCRGDDRIACPADECEEGAHDGAEGEALAEHEWPGAEAHQARKNFIKQGMHKEWATSREHHILHYPKNPYCDCCREVRAIASPARRIRPGAESVRTERFGDLVHMDHIIMNSASLGREGETCCLILLDDFTGFVGAYPAKDRSAAEVVAAMRHFVGRQREWRNVAVKADNTKEYDAACKDLGVAYYRSTPYRHQSNGRIERMNRSMT